MATLKFNSEYLNDYLAMVEDTESPRIYHVWAALTIMGAAMGRRCYFKFGADKKWPNLFTLIIGNPATRKSTVTNAARRIVRKSTKLRMAPKDTSGQRQGLISAIRGADHDNRPINENFDVALADKQLGDRYSIADLAGIESKEFTPEESGSSLDKNCIFCIESEFTGFIGQNNTQMLEFLISMFDGEDYDYQLKNSLTVLKDPLMSILAATNPTSLSESLPSVSQGGGFMSRVILVYGNKKYKLVSRPKEPDQDLVNKINERVSNAYYHLEGEFTETKEAFEYWDGLYKNYVLEITDSRFAHYAQRRCDHLIKLGMILAGARGDMVITKADYEEGHKILRATERGMPDALGQFGMNPLAQLKQQILEYVRLQAVVELDSIHAQFHRDGGPKEISEALESLATASQIKIMTDEKGGVKILAQYSKRDDSENEMMSLLTEKEE